MAAPSETNVQVPPNSTGGIVRMLQLTVLDSGVPTTVLMQVMQIADEFGNPLEVQTVIQQHQEILDEVRAIRLGIQELISAGCKPHEVFNLIEVSREIRHDPDSALFDEE